MVPKLTLEEDIIREINAKHFTALYDLPYVLLGSELAKLEELVNSSPIVYSLKLKESPVFPNGIALQLVCEED